MRPSVVTVTAQRGDGWRTWAQDDPERFFGRRGAEVPPSLLMRWKAAAEALRDITGELK